MIIKTNDIVRVKLAGDVYKVKVVKVNPKTFLALMTQTKTKYHKVRKDQTGQMSLFDTVDNVHQYVKVPYTVRVEKLVKIPKGKLVSVDEVDTSRGSDKNTIGGGSDKNAIEEAKLPSDTATVVDSPSAGSALDEMLASLNK